MPMNTAADEAFKKLKVTFNSAPILQHPDLLKSFIVEVDVSESGVGAVLSQCFREKPKFHPLAF